MKNVILTISCALLLVASAKAGPAEEKAFTDKYKTAFEAKDMATLQSLFYTTGSDPTILGFYQMMLSAEAGNKIAKIELVALSPEDATKASAAMDSPNGGKVCLTLKPTRKLVVEVSMKDANGSGNSKTENFVAEKDGKLVIPVPGPCK